MFTTTNILLPALLFSVIGIVIGVVAVLLIVDRTRTKVEDNNSPEPSSPAQDLTPTLPTDRFENVARLYRERTSGRLVVEVDKKIYLTPDSAPANVLSELESAVDSLTTWLGKNPSAVPPPALTKVEAPLQPEPPAPFVTPVSPVPVKPAANEPPRATSIVGQINDILQEILADSDLSTHKLSLTQEPSMGVVVWVDGVKYPSIDEVQDIQIRELIKKAVKMWERKNDLSRRYP